MSAYVRNRSSTDRPRRIEVAMTRADPADEWLPTDVLLVVATLVVANAGIFFAPWRPLRVSLGLVLLLVLPGYAFTTLLFPRQNGPNTTKRGGIDGLERAALTFGTSVALLPPLYLLAFAAVDGAVPSRALVFGVLNGFVLVATLLGLLRRLRIDASRRFDPSPRRWLFDAGGVETDRRTLLANLALGLAAVTAIGTLVYAVSMPPDGEHFSEFYLVTENDAGEYTAGGYRTTLVAGEPQSGIVGVENHEDETVTYTVVAELQRVEDVGERIEVLERGDRTQRTFTLADGESTYIEQATTPTMIGEDLRLHYGLYRGDPGGEPPYRELQLWVDVVEESTGPADATRG